MTDTRITELTEGLGVKECSHCDASEFWVHKDFSYKIDVSNGEVHETSGPLPITNLRCAKCGQLISDQQNLVVFQEAIKAVLKEDVLEREPTTEEFLDFWHYLDGDIPQWIRDNVKAYIQAKAYDKRVAEERKSEKASGEE